MSREQMRKEMESAIEDASNGLHDSTSWWDDYYTDIYGKPLIQVLLDNLEDIARRHASSFGKPRSAPPSENNDMSARVE